MRVRHLFAFVFGAALAGSVVTAAKADCNPLPGLSIDQFYAVCQGDLQQAYSTGMGQGQPFDVFVRWIYSGYVAGPQMSMQNQQSPTLIQNCPLGQTQCFAGWFRRCEVRGNVTMWITGAQRCR